MKAAVGAHPINFVKQNTELQTLTRRQLLKRCLAVSGSIMVGGGFVMSSKELWALETNGLPAEVMATLIQMARDVYPHDRFSDGLYAAAVKGHDERAVEDADHKAMIIDGVQQLDTLAQSNGAASYIATGWEADRVTILKSIEGDSFFQTIRGGLVVGLYNQPEVWAMLGYEGSSFEKGGYINRGFDDISWL